MGVTEATKDSRVVVLEIDLKGQPVLIGLLADRVFEVMELPAAALESAPSLGMRWRAEFIRSIGKRGDDFIIVLDMDRVFAPEESPSQRGQGRAE
jgi:purine-binding chemotaxis protein CheW